MKIAIAIARNTKYFLFKNEEDLFLNEEDPHLEHTILPPCLLYTSPSPRDEKVSRMPSSA